MNEILREFVLETHENLALLDSDLVTLETRPTDKSTLAQVFRTLHSVKGTAGFIGLAKLQAVAHSAESLLSRLRDGELKFNRPIATALLRVVDAIREVIANIEQSGEEGTGDYAALIAELDHLRTTGGESLNVGAIPTAAAPSASTSPPAASAPPPVAPPQPAAGPVEPVVELRVVASSPAPFTAAQVPAPSHAAAAASGPLEPASAEATEPKAPGLADSSIRVDVTLLDKLMTLVGELVLARNQIIQYSALHEDSGFVGAAQRLNLLTTELQASVMKTRMQPIGNVWNKFPRVVRDLALACEKKVRFEMDGQETELDKTLIEAIRDPLTHMVRNAVDHGIEPPAVRKSRGKPEEGRLQMHAFHEGGKVIIEIQDDGGGIDVGRVRDKAIHARLITPQDAARMSRAELLRLIFAPGFSTADKVTQFSGRGVGMDVVRTNIERIGGTVDIESVEGQGTTIRTKIPLTLAIVPALIVTCGGERYAIPQVSLLELVRLDGDQAARVELMQGVPVFRLRGNLLPLVYLREQLELDGAGDVDQAVNIVVLQADDRQFGLVVDGVRDTEEIVVKPLQSQLKGIGVFAGATIMGDGRVALILDVLGIAQRSNVVTGSRGKSLVDHGISEGQPKGEAESYLLFSGTRGGQMALPLSQVARLEEFSRTRLEAVGGRSVVQYRGEILPLVDVSSALDSWGDGHAGRRDEGQAGFSTAAGMTRINDAESVPVIVCSLQNHRVGFVVGQILDVVHEEVIARSNNRRAGVSFTAVIHGKVTEFIDLPSFIA